MKDKGTADWKKSLVAGSTIQTQLGSFKIDGPPLGEGGKSIVYPLAFSVPAALKVLKPGADTKTIERFLREYGQLVTVSHTNVVKLFHFDTLQIGDTRTLIIIMERCTGSLAKLWDRSANDRIHFRQVLHDVLSGLEHIHRHRIVHRDIKPENVLRREDGGYVIADFGIASFEDVKPGLTERADRLANFSFSAPEQLDASRKPTPATDLFAVGQLAHWMLTGEALRGVNEGQLTWQDGSNCEHSKLIHSLLQQDPTRRPQSATAALSQLRKELEPQVEVGRPSDLIKEVENYDRRLRRIAPGNRQLLRLNDRSAITNALKILGEEPEACALWWTRGNSHSEVRRFKQVDVSTWQIDHIECQISELWLAPGYPSIYHGFVLIASVPMQRFGIYGGTTPDDEEAALFKGKYITRAEYDDGFARIDGATVELNGEADVRLREYRTRYRFFVPRHHPLLCNDSVGDLKTAGWVADCERGNSPDERLRLAISQLPIHPDLAPFR